MVPMLMSQAQRDHYIPQCYLKGFTSDGTKRGKLFVVDVRDGKTFRTAPCNVAVETGFDQIEGLPKGHFNRLLSSFEAEADAALKRVRRARSIDDDEDWNAILNLIALLAVRNPRLRHAYQTFREDSLKMMMGVLLDTPERWVGLQNRMKKSGRLAAAAASPSYEDIKTYAQEGDYELSFLNHSNIKAELKSHDAILQLLGRRTWRLCRSGCDTERFVTTDHPVWLAHSDGRKSSYTNPVGYGTIRTSVIIALSSQLVAIGTFNPMAIGVVECSPLQVAFINRMIISSAERQIYASGSGFKVILEGNRKPVTGEKLALKLNCRAKQGS